MKKIIKKVKLPAPATKKTKSKTVQAKQSVKKAAHKAEPKIKVKKKLVVVKLPPSKVSNVSLQPAPTLITATIDVGFGNSLYLRGQGPGLSWDQGIELTNQGADVWTLALPPSHHRVVFKLLVNDQRWSIGEDYIASPGSHVTVAPIF